MGQAAEASSLPPVHFKSLGGAAGPLAMSSPPAPLPVNQVILGDCIEELARLPAECADLVFADPPYFLQLKDPLRRPNRTFVDGVHAEWDKFSSLSEYDDFTRTWLSGVCRIMKPQATLFVIGSYHNVFRLGSILQDLDFWILNDIIWHKANPMPNFRGRRFTNAHETLIWAARSRSAKDYIFDYQRLKAGNDDIQVRSDWLLPICTGGERLKDTQGLKLHPTQKPEALLTRILLAASQSGELVVDPFFGTGTTGAVAKRLGRGFIGIERDPIYAKAAKERIAAIRPLPQDLIAAPANKPAERRIPFSMILEVGLITPGETLVDQHRHYAATVMPGGALSFGSVIASIHKAGALAQGLQSCNGWTFWHYQWQNQLRPIDELRKAARADLAAAEIT